MYKNYSFIDGGDALSRKVTQGQHIILHCVG